MATVQEYLENSLNNESSKTSSQMDQTNSSASNIPYILFVYREELRRLNKQSLKLSKSKLHLTQELVSYSMDRIKECDMQELMNINRQINFTRKLKQNMKQMQKYRSMPKAQTCA